MFFLKKLAGIAVWYLIQNNYNLWHKIELNKKQAF